MIELFSRCIGSRNPGLRLPKTQKCRMKDGGGSSPCKSNEFSQEDKHGTASIRFHQARGRSDPSGNLVHRNGDRASAIAAMRRGIDLGMTHIDTAEMYGTAEDVIAEAIVGRRDQVFLVSKVLPGNASRTGTIAACEKSLARLHTDRLDSYLLHWRGQHPLEDTISAFEQLQHEGKTLLGCEQLRCA